MKKRIALILVLAMVVSLCACFDKRETVTQINVYFKDGATGELKSEKVKYNGKQSAVDMASFAMNKLIEGPEDDRLVSVMDNNVKFGNVSVKNEEATVDFSEEFKLHTGIEELLVRFSVVRTLCDIPGISAVSITVDGLPLVSNATGKEIGVMNKKDLISGIDTQIETLTLTLYFATANSNGLKAENRQVETYDTVSMEKTIINELLKGPSSKELEAAIPAGTKVKSIETKEGVCYVNFSEEFINNFAGGDGMVVVYSIVNSLCSLENISAVQILVEGKLGAKFANYTFDAPLKANKSIVVTK